MMSAAFLTLLALCGAAGAPAQDREELRRARAALRRGDYPAAERAFERIVQSRPEAWDPRAGLVRARLEQGKYDAAAGAAEAFLRRVPDHPGARTALAQAAFERGDPARAVDLLGAGLSDVRARALAARALAELDRNKEAVRAAEPLLDAYARRGDDFMKEELFAVAQGLLVLARRGGSAEAARKATGLILPDLLKADPSDAAARTLQGQVMLDAGDLAAAAREFEAALETNPHFVPALLGQARLLAQAGRPGDAEPRCLRALEVNPAHPEALALRAELRLVAGPPEAALELASKALETVPTSARLFALLAAARSLAGDPRHAEDLRKASALRPGSEWASFELARLLLACGSRRYEDIHALLRRAAGAKNPSPAQTAAFGLSCLRAGEEADARKALEDASRRDPLDRQAAAALALMDVLDRDSDVVEQGPIRLRLAREERRFTERPALEILTRAWDDLSRRYGTAPPAPVRVELLWRAGDFSVRTGGLPPPGACFGRVAVALSPRARDASEPGPAPFRWGAVLRRQIARAFSIGLSGGRAPEWLVEGLAAVEESLGPGGLREKDLWTLTARAGLRELESSDPSPRAAAPAVFFLVERHSFEAAARLLRGYAGGKKTAELFREVLGVTVEEFDAAFAAWLKARREATRYAPRPAPDAPGAGPAQAARALLGADDARAEETARRAVRADPDGSDAHSALGQALVRRRQYEEALAHLRRGRDDYSTWQARGVALAELQRPREAAEAFRRAVACFPSWVEDPVEEGAWRRLNEALLAVKDYDGALEAFGGMVAAEPHDFRNRIKLAALLHERKDFARLATLLEEASWIETRDLTLLDLQAAVHRARREFADATEKTLAALAVLETDPKPDEEGAADRAFAERYCAIGEDWLARGDKAKAREYAQDALRRVSGMERARALYEAGRRP
jgi:tetratricopeptide (TPR) repeat protein